MRWNLRLMPFLLLLQGVSAAPKLAVERAVWGFAGEPIKAAFNPLTIEVKNISGEPFHGVIELVRKAGLRSVGMPERHHISLVPGGRRTVQFLPYFSVEAFEGWRVSWWQRKGGGGGHFDLSYIEPQLLTNSPVTVEIIDDMRPFVQVTGGLPTFPERYFPTNASATTGLAAVVLAYEPQWGPARAKSFWQWLKRGGTLHLLPKEDGSPWQFRGPLSPLNEAATTTAGYGRIIRYDERRPVLTVKEVPAEQTAAVDALPNNDSRSKIFRAFGTATLPAIPWPLIYFGAFLYLLFIGPCHYLFGRGTKRDYRVTVLALVAIVSVFSWIFIKIGHRGYGESNKWFSAAIAQPLGDGTHDVLQWSHAFVTKGDSYQFRYPSSHQLFEVQHDGDSVPGLLQGGTPGFLQIDLPLFSSRNLISRAILEGPDIQARVKRRVPRLEFEITGEVEIEHAWSRKGDKIVLLRNVSPGSWVPQGKGLGLDGTPRRYRGRRGVWESSNELLQRELLVAWWRDSRGQAGEAVARAELLIYAKAPDSFSPESPAFEVYESHVLYVIPLRDAMPAAREEF